MSPNTPLAKASILLTEHIEEVRAAALKGRVVDLACGSGRHTLLLAKAGIPVLGLDRNRDHLRELEAGARQLGDKVTTVRCDLETQHGIPVRPGSCGAILVFRFLFRPLAAAIEEALRPGGILLYETFALAHRETGRGPRRKEFFLEPDELPALFPNLEVISYREGPDAGTPPDITARLLARKPD
ncbi:MAG: class I SAM-dependent methyltransferase [Myxococcales bacterium]|nr:class I SAM-dependent methyltransferase [Myxococcales bacterium]MCH7867453.1 class I SAM-dependent methyltransferase [Myxococcales bacterium]